MKNTINMKKVSTEADESAQAHEEWLDLLETFNAAERELARADEAAAALKADLAGIETERESLLASRSSIETLADALSRLVGKRDVLERRLRDAQAHAEIVRGEFRVIAKTAVGAIHSQATPLLAEVGEAVARLRVAVSSPRFLPGQLELRQALDSCNGTDRQEVFAPRLVRSFERHQEELVRKALEISDLAADVSQRWEGIVGEKGGAL